MAIRHIATVLCDYLIRADDGRFTLAGVFQNIQANRLPAVKDPLGLYVQFYSDEDEPYEIILKAPDGEEKVLSQGAASRPRDLKENLHWSTTFAAVITAVLHQAGTWAVILRSRGADVHTHRFGVLPPPETDEASQEEHGE